MSGPDHPSRKSAPPRRESDRQLCCVYWCRDPAAVIVELEDGAYGCCRKHAAFIKVGRMDWFERRSSGPAKSR